LTPPQAFLLLGKGGITNGPPLCLLNRCLDGVDSRSLSNMYHVRMTYLANPLSLQVEGKVKSLKQFAKHLDDLKAVRAMIDKGWLILMLTQAITEEVFELPTDTPIRSYLLHRISRLSGALTENFGQQKVFSFFPISQADLCSAGSHIVQEG
jgi:hypothetical protein